MIYTNGKKDFQVQYTESKAGGKTSRELFVQVLAKPERQNGATVRKFIGSTIGGPKVKIIKAGKGSQWKIEGYRGVYTWKTAWNHGVNILASKI